MRYFLPFTVFLILFSGCDKYYEKKYDEKIVFNGRIADSTVAIDRVVNENTFRFDHNGSFIVNVVNLTYVLTGDLDCKSNNCYRIGFEIILNTGTVSKPNAKNIAKSINNPNDESSFSLYSCDDEICVGSISKLNSNSGEYTVTAENKGDWLFIKGTINKADIGGSFQGEQVENIDFELISKIEL